MAIRSQITCLKCGESVSVMHSVSRPAPDICPKCDQKEKNNKKSKALIKLKKLSLEKRVSRLESIQYDEEHAPPPWDGRIG